MCGIFAAFNTKMDKKDLYPHFETIKHRGPDHSEYALVKKDIHFGFHRLMINGQDQLSNQPFHIDNVWLIANAEIFNYKELAQKHDITLTTNSDCEILIHLYKKIGLNAMLNELVAEYAFVLYDESLDKLFVCRDHLGVRGLYYGEDHLGGVYFASEAKALTFCKKVRQFLPRHYWDSESQAFTEYYQLKFESHQDQSETTHLEKIHTLLTKAVKDRMLSERKIGCLLSGGLDSSLVSAIVAKNFKNPKDLETFSIGLEGSPDLEAAQAVADHIGTSHHSIVMTEAEFIAGLEETVYITGSFDVTTIRASVGHQLVSNWVKQNSDVKVLFTGETIDEMGSYLYFQQAPSPEAFQEEGVRLLKDIHLFDMLRGDRSISSAGIEARVPFADRSFVEYYMGIDPTLRMFDGDQIIEKHLLRKAFEKDQLLPEEVLWRRKNGFSDSVSQKNRSWSEIIRDYVDTKVSDGEYLEAKEHDLLGGPPTKEAYYYKKLFVEKYGARNTHLTPYQWLPKWCGDVVDPSARVLKIYQAD